MLGAPVQRAAGVVCCAWLAALAAGTACRPEPAPASARAGTLHVEDVLGGDPSGFAVADGSRPLRFPGDHGPHPEFRSEWWYVAGSLTAAGGRALSYQLTIFRTALDPDPSPRSSAWAASQLYMGHLAVGDPGAGRFRAHERFARGSLGLAGAAASPFRVWVEDWTLAGPPGETPGAPDALAGLLPMRVRAGQGEVGIDLLLERDRPLVLQGDDGLSRKGAAPANASYYYSVTRMRTSGTVRVAGREHEVQGLSWLDREWSTSALEAGQAGWDWFALQLEDGSDLMLYRMRRSDGGRDPHDSGTVVRPDGGIRHLAAGDFTIEALAHWTSPHSGARYPARWRVLVPAAGYDLVIEPLMADQELDLAFRYWEGAVQVRGTRRGVPVAGRGFVELTGYPGAGDSEGPPRAPDRDGR